jgi:hypothetical protein
MADRDILMESPRKKVAYDPDQDPEEKRVLRQKYRVLLKDEEGTMGGHLSSSQGEEIEMILCQATNTTSMNIQHKSCSKRFSWPIHSLTKVSTVISLHPQPLRNHPLFLSSIEMGSDLPSFSPLSPQYRRHRKRHSIRPFWSPRPTCTPPKRVR